MTWERIKENRAKYWLLHLLMELDLPTRFHSPIFKLYKQFHECAFRGSEFLKYRCLMPGIIYLYCYENDIEPDLKNLIKKLISVGRVSKTTFNMSLYFIWEFNEKARGKNT